MPSSWYNRSGRSTLHNSRGNHARKSQLVPGLTMLVVGMVIFSISRTWSVLFSSVANSAMGNREWIDPNSPTFAESNDISGSTTSLKDKPTVTTTSTAPVSAKYLVYFSKEGWSNQETCLKNAYFMAHATNRILVVPPILPHANWGLSLYNNISALTNDGLGRSPPSTSYLMDFYFQNAPSAKYVRMQDVVDLEYTLPNITTIEFRAFFNEIWSKQKKEKPSTFLSNYILEHNFSNHNTLFIRDQLWMENRDQYIHYDNKFWGGAWGITEKFIRQDIGRLGLEEQSDIWTFWDAFDAKIEWSAIPPELGQSQYYRFRFTDSIRSVAKATYDGWGGFPYASVHVRAGGDDEYGCFMQAQTIDHHINRTMTGVLAKMQNWTEHLEPSKRPKTVGLFIATDSVKELRSGKWEEMTKKKNEITQTMKQNYGITVKFEDSTSFQFGTPKEEEKLRKSVRYADVFLDQQLAACAEIAFVGSDSPDCFSTFSRLIWSIRHSPGACW